MSKDQTRPDFQTLDTNDKSKKQWDEPESIRVHIDREFGIVRDIKRESGLERADTLSWMNLLHGQGQRNPQPMKTLSEGCGLLF
jgi:hypothetical protein